MPIAGFCPASNLFSIIYSHCVFVIFTVMQTAWRERKPQARIKAAQDALEKNPE